MVRLKRNSNTLRLWKFDETAKRVTSTETHIGVNRRIVRNIQVHCVGGMHRSLVRLGVVAHITLRA